jgi:branched-chain amino acid transport system substrate-binding protein
MTTSSIPDPRKGRRLRRSIVGAVAVASTLAACTEPIVATGPAGPATVRDEAVAQLVTYTGGRVGEAVGEPVRIGYVNQEGGTPSFAEATFGADAAVDLVNRRLGGVGGRPLELVKCSVRAEEDGLACAQKMLADDRIAAVLTGAMFAGNAPLLGALKDRKPVFMANPLTPTEAVHPDGFAFTPGAPGVVEGLVTFVSTMLDPVPRSVAVVYAANPAGEAAYRLLIENQLRSRGMDVRGVAVADTAGPQEYGPAIEAAGAQQADLLIALTTAPGCIGTYDALQALAVSITVVTTGLCFGLSMQQHLAQLGVGGDAPNGWFFGAYGYSYFISEPGIDDYLAIVKAYARQQGIGRVDYTGFAGPLFANVLVLARFLNERGADAGPDDLRASARAFTGPVFGVAGELACGANPVFPALCGSRVGVQQYLDGRWLSIADAYNGASIAVNQPFVGSTTGSRP